MGGSNFKRYQVGLALAALGFATFAAQDPLTAAAPPFNIERGALMAGSSIATLLSPFAISSRQPISGLNAGAVK